MNIPISLYIHIPWCKKKCPYCDFNSHTKSEFSYKEEERYMEKLIEDFEEKSKYAQGREITSIFIGGGTPSLLSSDIYKSLFAAINKKSKIPPDIEITIEINPGTLSKARIEEYRKIGINRVSIGAQSTQNDKLRSIQRIHNSRDISFVVSNCKNAGFENINIDLMFGLPDQSIGDIVSDLRNIVKAKPTHISWYQFTLEPGTHLYKTPPILPIENKIWDAQEIGKALLEDSGFAQYEISAFAKEGNKCRHNTNYWEFGDYIGIGAGAHGKITLPKGEVYRYNNKKNPKKYLASDFSADIKLLNIPKESLVSEFMMNSLRLINGISIKKFEERTGLSKNILNKSLSSIRKNKMINFTENRIFLTKFSRNYLNEVLSLF